MQGKIVKGIAGFYYVYAEDGCVYECKARGIFRKDKITPLVGDNVEFTITDDTDKEGSISEILPRINSLIRPAVANVDQAVVFFARSNPDPDMGLVDRLLISMEKASIETVLVFNKSDLDSAASVDFENEKAGFRDAGYPVYDICVRTGEGLDSVKEALKRKTSALAGPSGAGKSSFINAICPDASMETGELSDKLGRGRNTTRHAQLLVIDGDSFIMDTPGFTSFEIASVKPEELSGMYPEFAAFAGTCRFSGCSHTHEPDCGVMQAVAEGEISGYRYNRYKRFYEELQSVRRY
ncbi:MAG: ribosome small subunit-dependent GTPase A [Lachnospiraceae bacterium]|nr:ribosome small subunit-dependent GTPase A [Lachnospiraceae bacterium]